MRGFATYSRNVPPHPRSAWLLAALLAVVSACAQPATGAETIESGTAPEQSFAVGLRRLALSRGPDRPLPSIVWYPAAGAPGGVASADAAPAIGRFPVVLFSHGLGGQPEGFADITEPLAAAGFVVVAPAYPFTRKQSPAFDRNDVRNQPADANFVLSEMAELNGRAGEPLAGHLMVNRMCAAGFSAGGFTTSGMFTAERNRRLRCGIVISAGAMEGGFTGSPAPILFLHGDADKVVVFSRGRTAYENLNWPKAFITMYGQGHGEFLDSRRPGFVPARAAITDFLRWNLYSDSAARDRLTGDGTVIGVASFDNRL
jgi:dienelactone hydrolase